MSEQPGHKPSSTATSPSTTSQSEIKQEPVRLMISGSRWSIKVMIHTLFKLGVAPVDAWSKPQQLPHSDRLMSIMTKQIKLPEQTERNGQTEEIPKP